MRGYRVVHPRLVGVQAKIDRAGEHIEEINTAAESWLKDCAQPKFETEVDGEWEIVRLRVPEAPPPRISVIAGDVVHNLRSSLDHLAWQLVESISGKATGDNYFPILMNEADFKARVWKPRRNRQGRPVGPLVGIPLTHPVVKIIESHQPYIRRDPKQGLLPDDDAIVFVNRMWNIDKHRILHTTFLAAPSTAKEVFDLFEWDQDVTLIEQHVGGEVMRGTFEDRIELARFRFAPNQRPKPYVRAKGEIPTAIMIGYRSKPPAASLRIGLRAWDPIIRRIREIVTDTERFL